MFRCYSPTRMRRPARATKCRSRVDPSPSSMDQRYTDRWARMPAIECSWAVVRESVGHVPVPASGALAPIGVTLAMATWEGRCNSPLVRSAGSVEACEARETGGFQAGADRPTGPRRQGARESVCGATTVVAHLAHSYRRLTGARVSPVAVARVSPGLNAACAPHERRAAASLPGRWSPSPAPR